MAEETTVQTGKSITIRAKTFRPGKVIPEYQMKAFQERPDYQEYYDRYLISMEDYLKAQQKNKASGLKEADKNKISEPSDPDLPEAEEEPDDNNFDDVSV